MTYYRCIRRNAIISIMVALILLGQFAPAYTQDAQPIHLIVDFSGSVQMPGEITWSNDSQILAFADIITLPTNEWYLYDVRDGTLASGDQRPFQSELTANGCPQLPP